MTFSILCHDEKTGTFMAAAATGALCVGGWVIRGNIDAGLVASQGTAPSTFWRDDALRLMHGGQSAKTAVATVTVPDRGRAHRQMIALDRNGGTAGFTGSDSIPVALHHVATGLAVAGNMLAGPEVIDALAQAANAPPDADPAVRMIAALRAAERAGSDKRGLMSAALLVLCPQLPPLDLRIDYATDPIGALDDLRARAQSPAHSAGLDEVPAQVDPMRFPTRAR